MMNRYIVFHALGAACLLVISCLERDETGFEGQSDLIGKWVGRMVDSEQPSKNRFRQSVWVVARDGNGRYSVTEYIANNEKGIYFQIAATANGRWKVVDDELHEQLDGSDRWQRSKFTMRSVNKSVLSPLDQEATGLEYIEIRMDDEAGLHGYKLVSEEVFDNCSAPN